MSGGERKSNKETDGGSWRGQSDKRRNGDPDQRVNLWEWDRKKKYSTKKKRYKRKRKKWRENAREDGDGGARRLAEVRLLTRLDGSKRKKDWEIAAAEGLIRSERGH